MGSHFNHEIYLLSLLVIIPISSVFFMFEFVYSPNIACMVINGKSEFSDLLPIFIGVPCLCGDHLGPSQPGKKGVYLFVCVLWIDDLAI